MAFNNVGGFVGSGVECLWRSSQLRHLYENGECIVDLCCGDLMFRVCVHGVDMRLLMGNGFSLVSSRLASSVKVVPQFQRTS